jgi:glycosyltransferase involved in cell wall biosynthesis
MDKKVTIIIPVFNAEKYVSECIMSAIRQTYDNIQIIVVDNESTDNSVDIIESIVLMHSQVEFYRAPNLYKHSWDEPRDEALKHADGEYIHILAADDVLESQFIEYCMRYFAAAPDKIKAIQSTIQGQGLSDILYNYNSIEQFKELCLFRCPVNTPTVVYHRSIFENKEIKTKPELYGGAADYDLYCQMADKDIMIYPIPLNLGYYYRWHPEQASWGVHKDGINYDAMIQHYWREKWKK